MAAAIRRVNSMQYDVYTQTEVSNGKTIEAVPAILQKTAKEHQKQVKKVDSTAGVISKMTRSAHLKQVKKVARAVTVKATTSRANQ